MWITGPNRLGRVAPGNSARRRSGSGFTLDSADDTPTSVAAPSGQAIQGIDALLALQGVDTPASHRRQAIQYGNDLLDQLEDLRLDLLAGRIDPSRIERMISVVRRRADTDDPQLDRLIREIELRASVELAKLGQFVD
ncbi:MAG: flagellar assembly protein FliX [Hyphomicrobiales bacterium]|nr:flagellar assembly protein FliX [Hyphomicrobiales bacterium]